MSPTPTLLGLLLVLTTFAPAQGEIAIRARRIHLGDGTVVDNGVVLVRGGRIVAVGPEVAVPEGATFIDRADGELVPGLVDGHTYAGLPRGENENEETSELTPLVRASLAFDPTSDALARVRRVGVTTLGVHPGKRNVCGGLLTAVKPLDASGRDLLLADRVGLGMTFGLEPTRGNRGVSRFGGGMGFFNRLPTARMGVVYLARTMFQELEAVAQGREEAAPRHDVLRDVVEGRIPVFWKARLAKEMRSVLLLCEEFGIPRPIVCDAAEAHLVADELAQAGASVILGPLEEPDPPRSGARRSRDVRHRLDTAARLLRAGVPFALGNGGTEEGSTLLDFARFSVRYGLPAAEAIRRITLEPARLLGVSDRVGSLEAGKDADLVLLDGDPLSPTSAIDLVMINGRIVHRREAAPERSVE